MPLNIDYIINENSQAALAPLLAQKGTTIPGASPVLTAGDGSGGALTVTLWFYNAPPQSAVSTNVRKDGVAFQFEGKISRTTGSPVLFLATEFTEVFVAGAYGYQAPLNLNTTELLTNTSIAAGNQISAWVDITQDEELTNQFQVPIRPQVNSGGTPPTPSEPPYPPSVDVATKDYVNTIGGAGTASEIAVFNATGKPVRSGVNIDKVPTADEKAALDASGATGADPLVKESDLGNYARTDEENTFPEQQTFEHARATLGGTAVIDFQGASSVTVPDIDMGPATAEVVNASTLKGYASQKPADPLLSPSGRSVDGADIRLRNGGGVSFAAGNYAIPSDSPLGAISSSGTWTIFSRLSDMKLSLSGGSAGYFGLTAFGTSTSGTAVLLNQHSTTQMRPEIGNYSGGSYTAVAVGSDAAPSAYNGLFVVRCVAGVITLNIAGVALSSPSAVTSALLTNLFAGVPGAGGSANYTARYAYAANRVLTDDEITLIEKDEFSDSSVTIDYLRRENVSRAGTWRGLTDYPYIPSGSATVILPQPQRERHASVTFNLSTPVAVRTPPGWSAPSRNSTGVCRIPLPAYVTAGLISAVPSVNAASRIAYVTPDVANSRVDTTVTDLLGVVQNISSVTTDVIWSE